MRPPPLPQVSLLAAESAALVGFLPRLVWSPVRSVVVGGGAVRVDLVGALVGASVAVFLMRIFGLRWRIVPVRPLGSRILTKKSILSVGIVSCDVLAFSSWLLLVVRVEQSRLLPMLR